MKKRVYIVVEGQTEEEFVKTVLAPYLSARQIYITPVVIHTSKGHKGGFVNYMHLKNDVMRLLKSQGNDIVVTTFVDFFRCPELPDPDKWSCMADHAERANAMEAGMYSDINDYRFIPYIQLHEFEALLFSSNLGFQKYFENNACAILDAVIKHYPNPEDINSTPDGAPSKRLQAAVTGYDKVLYGNVIALEVGIAEMIQKCPRFRNWLDTLISRC